MRISYIPHTDLSFLPQIDPSLRSLPLPHDTVRMTMPRMEISILQDSGSKPQNLILQFSALQPVDRKSTRLNSSHVAISYAVFCLKKKKHERRHQQVYIE